MNVGNCWKWRKRDSFFSLTLVVVEWKWRKKDTYIYQITSMEKALKVDDFPFLPETFCSIFFSWLSCIHIHWNKWATCLIKNVNMISGLCSFCTILYEHKIQRQSRHVLFCFPFSNVYTVLSSVVLVCVLDDDDTEPMTKISTLYDTV